MGARESQQAASVSYVVPWYVAVPVWATSTGADVLAERSVKPVVVEEHVLNPACQSPLTPETTKSVPVIEAHIEGVE